MTRAFARSRKGERAVDHAPQGHWATTTLIAALGWRSAIAPMVLEGPMTTAAFEAYVEHILAPELPPRAIVVMDNLSSHKSPSVSALFAKAGAQLLYLPPYSPDLNPIEMMWSKVKSHLRGAQARTQEELWSAIAQSLEQITPSDAHGVFSHCGVGMIS
jgi:putative transposase